MRSGIWEFLAMEAHFPMFNCIVQGTWHPGLTEPLGYEGAAAVVTGAGNMALGSGGR